MPPGPVGVPGASHCFTPAVAASALDSGFGFGPDMLLHRKHWHCSGTAWECGRESARKMS